MGRQATQDLSSFMCIVLMTIGFLVTILVINVIVITSSNPTNVEITSVVKFSFSESEQVEGVGVPLFYNKAKEPVYIDVHRDHVVLYPGEVLVSVGELEEPGNALERMLKVVERNKELEYVCMLLRPRSAVLARRLKKIVKAQGIDVGQELYEMDRKVDYQRSERAPDIIHHEEKPGETALPEAGLAAPPEPEAGTAEAGPPAAPVAPAEPVAVPAEPTAAPAAPAAPSQPNTTPPAP